MRTVRVFLLFKAAQNSLMRIDLHFTSCNVTTAYAHIDIDAETIYRAALETPQYNVVQYPNYHPNTNTYD